MEPEKKSNGALVGLIVIIIILVIGGIYMWQSNKNAMPIQPETVTSQDSSDINALEQDLGTVDTSVGVDANTID